jgi:hypothetical protein
VPCLHLSIPPSLPPSLPPSPPPSLASGADHFAELPSRGSGEDDAGSGQRGQGADVRAVRREGGREGGYRAGGTGDVWALFLPFSTTRGPVSSTLPSSPPHLTTMTPSPPPPLTSPHNHDTLPSSPPHLTTMTPSPPPPSPHNHDTLPSSPPHLTTMQLPGLQTHRQ